MEQNRRRRAKRKRKKLLRFFVKLGVRMAVIIVSFYVLWGILKSDHSIFGLGGQIQYVDAAQSQLTKPKLYEGSDLEKELESLAQESSDYREIYEKREQYPEDVLTALCANPEMVDFVKNYLEADGTVSGGITKKEMRQDIPLLIQWDERWGYAGYGQSDVGLSGCAPTCISMVAVGLTKDKSLTPDVVAEYACREGYYMDGTGTAWSFMTEGCRHFGIIGKELGLDESMIQNNLASGNPIICSMRPGDFTTQGHFIVLSGIQDGKIIVNDPNSRQRSSVLWDYETLKGQIKNLWVFYKA